MNSTSAVDSRASKVAPAGRSVGSSILRMSLGLLLISSVGWAGAALAQSLVTSATASGNANAAEAKPAYKVIGADFPRREPSKVPTAEEWKTAEQVALTRTSAAASKCNVYRVREWLKIRCSAMPASAIAMLGGNVEGLLLWIDPNVSQEFGVRFGPGEVLFPVRPGDKRVLQFSTFGEGYEGPFGIKPAFVVSEHWVEGEPAPIIVMR